MRLKTIQVDGFKSYATPTVIGEFDASFNAITGLNGSGKSNILDAICFAMGITTLSSVRVSNLQELIYKQGTAGITKASVTLTFDNSDKLTSPTGYESDREITVTRQIFVNNPTKYMINGRKALATEVSNMFRSVQLNVNNPHFLIMQGRITKVLNMKPEEIRDMLQEALGTLMYETKKLEAQKKMAQKDIKVTAIRETLDKQITPRIEKLREDKKEYDRYNAVVQDLQRHKRFIIAYEFYSKQELVRTGREQQMGLADEIENQKTRRKQLAQEEKLALSKLEEKRKKRDAEASGPLKLAVEEEKAVGKALVQASADRDGAQEELKSELGALASNEQRCRDLTELLRQCESQAAEAQQAVVRGQQQVAEQRVQGEQARQGVESAETGSNAVLQQELFTARRLEQELATEFKLSDMTIKTKSEERGKLVVEYEREAREEAKHSDSVGVMAVLKQKVGEVQQQLSELPVAAAATANPAELTHKVKQLRSNTSSLTQFKFDATCLGAGKCLGRLAGLVHIKPELVSTHARALEVTAGGKLYQIVVDTKETSGKILKLGKLQQRVTIIPLNAVSARVADQTKVAYAAKKATGAGGWAMLALDACDQASCGSSEVWKAMQFTFGNVLICDSSRTAKLLAFDDKVRLRCVTLEGDLFDPSGTLTGGSRNTSNSNSLPALQELHELRQLERALLAAGEEEANRSSVEAKRVQLTRELGQCEHELQLVETRSAEAKSQRLQAQIRQVDADLAQAHSSKANSQTALNETKAKIADLTSSMQNSETLKQRLVSEAQKAESACKRQLKLCEESYQKALKRVEEVGATKANSAQEHDELVALVQNQQRHVVGLEAKVRDTESAFESSTRKFQHLRQAREEIERSFREFDGHIAELESQAARAGETARKLEMELKQLDANQSKLKVDVKTADESLAQIKRDHAWIDKEMQFFGKPHTEYDFEVKDPQAIVDKYRELETVQSSLSRSINKKALAMMEKSEEEYDALDRKRRTIESDRIAIERVIAGLDRKKNEALVAAYEKVNTDFGSIFSTLLPGARAELKPVENGTVLDGLEVRVAFGQTWKESLQELSGGQRSLLALSLVLALLRFKPAPLYILDEIDAALDLSHTQNIGVMLRTHFSESQFIVVSLKEGMFANASCLFRTRFVDGVSTVTRTVNRSFHQRVSDVATTGQKSAMKKKRAREEEEEEEEEAAVEVEN